MDKQNGVAAATTTGQQQQQQPTIKMTKLTKTTRTTTRQSLVHILGVAFVGNNNSSNCNLIVPKAHCLQRLATAAKINNYKYANGARIAAVDAAVVVVVAAATAVVVDSFIHKNRA